VHSQFAHVFQLLVALFGLVLNLLHELQLLLLLALGLLQQFGLGGVVLVLWLIAPDWRVK